MFIGSKYPKKNIYFNFEQNFTGNQFTQIRAASLSSLKDDRITFPTQHAECTAVETHTCGKREATVTMFRRERRECVGEDIVHSHMVCIV